MSIINDPIKSNANFETSYAGLAEQLLRTPPFDRGEVHAQKITEPHMFMHELMGVDLNFEVPSTAQAWELIVRPNLPWAEDHFRERVSGDPLNPPPSNDWWPFAQAGNAVHKKDEKFSHTYPERFWPRLANEGGKMHDSERASMVPHVGLRFAYGDLDDLVYILCKNRRSRQAYLPIWFPEDLRAAALGERVPCTLGYHFMLNWAGELDMYYPMRSCDLVRFFRDDVYMAGRLLQWVVNEVNTRTYEDVIPEPISITPGQLRMQINNLHCFVGDKLWLTEVIQKNKQQGKRGGYNFEAML